VTALTWRAEHLSDAKPFDCYLVAPATYNTIGKMAAGVADTVVTSALASALGRMQQGRTEVLVAPTMHGSMHHDVLVANCRSLAARGVRLVTPRDGVADYPEARKRLQRYPVEVANRGEETHGVAQVSYVVTRDGEQRVEGKPAIAAAIADLLERQGLADMPPNG